MKDILIVEDNALEREQGAAIFRNAQYLIDVCASAEEAERAITLCSYRLAFIDIGLGDRSGSHLFSILQKSRRIDRIIILTGNPSVSLRQRLIAEGATDYLTKGSPQAHPSALLKYTQDLLGSPLRDCVEGIRLEDFLSTCVPSHHRGMFYGQGESFPPCSACGDKIYRVIFSHEVQCPPQVHGVVVCARCGEALDPEV